MIHRLCRGLVPDKPHTTLKIDKQLAFEHCFTRQGFDGLYSIFYHRNPLHWLDQQVEQGMHPGASPQRQDGKVSRRHFESRLLPFGNTPFLSRHMLFENGDLSIWFAHCEQPDPMPVVNADGDELVFVFAGQGTLETPCGVLPFEADDYVYIPRALPHRWVLEAPAQLLILEAYSYVDIPPQFRHIGGQLKMDAPYSHRDFREPIWPVGGLTPPDGPCQVLVKREQSLTALTMHHHPFDVVGWDGQLWPYALPIKNFQPKTGLVHLPPTIHTTFAGGGFVVCSFVPRIVDFHPQAIPCPYPHSSVQCDELIFYVKGNFTSRRGIQSGSLSLHPMGMPHGPHPGTYEASVGTTRTDELAVMIDTFKPLRPTETTRNIEDLHYPFSWCP